MTRFELDLFMARGLIGLVEWMENHPTDAYSRKVQEIVRRNKSKIETWMERVLADKAHESYRQISAQEFDKWILKGLETFAAFIHRRANYETDLESSKKFTNLAEILEKCLIELRK